MHPLIFSSDAQVINHIWTISCFISPRLLGMDGLQCNFDNRELVGQPPLHGKDVLFLVDGAHGERLSDIDVLWSYYTGYVGIIVHQLP